MNGERARDGDYALNDLGAAACKSVRGGTRFRGTHRPRSDGARRSSPGGQAGRINLSTTTGFVNWKTVDETDLDYTPLPLIRRSNTEESFQFTQEVRVGSAAERAMACSRADVADQMAGRCVPVHAELRAGCHQHVLARSCSLHS